MAEQEAMGVQRALRRPGRPRRVDDDRRVLGGRVGGAGTTARRSREAASKSSVPSMPPPPTTIAVRRLGQSVADLGDFRPVRRVGDERARRESRSRYSSASGPNSTNSGHGDQARPVRGEVGDGGLVALREEDRHAVAGPQALRREHVGEPVRELARTRRTSSAAPRPPRPRRSAPCAPGWPVGVAAERRRPDVEPGRDAPPELGAERLVRSQWRRGDTHDRRRGSAADDGQDDVRRVGARREGRSGGQAGARHRHRREPPGVRVAVEAREVARRDLEPDPVARRGRRCRSTIRSIS